MEEISSSTVAVPYTLGKLTQESAVNTTHMEISGLKLMANTAATLILNPPMEDCEKTQMGCLSSQHHITVSADKKMNCVGDAPVSDLTNGCDRSCVVNETNKQNRKEDHFQCPNDSGSLYVCGGQSSTLRTNCSEIDPPISTIKVDEEDDIVIEPGKVVSFEMDIEIYDASGSDGCDSKPSDSLPAISEENIGRRRYQNGLEMHGGALWGFSSICGRRDEMEDAIAVEPQLMQLPSQMLMENHETENQQVHFFGVYDGHGGCQVCLNY